MQVEITGLEQGSILVEFQVLPREGEYLKIQQNDGIIEAEVASVTHSISTDSQQQHIKIALKPIN